MNYLKKYWLVIGIITLALFLRLPLLNSSFWLDEAAQALESDRPLLEQFNIAHDFQPPLIHLLVHFAMQISYSEWWLRSIAALIPALITIATTFFIAKKLFNNSTAVIASLLLASSSFHVFFSQELRPYSLPTMWACLSWWSLLQIFDKKNAKSLIKIGTQQNKNLIFYTLFNILGLYTSYLYPFLMLAQLIYLLVAKRKFLFVVLTSWLVSIIAYLPWLPMFWRQLQTGQTLRQAMPNWENVVSIPQFKALVMVPAKFLFGLIDLELELGFIVLSSIMLLLTIMAGLAIIFGQLNQKTNNKRHHFWLIGIWLLVPLITAWLISFVIPILRPKRVLYLLPAFYIFIAALINQNWQLKGKHLVNKFLAIFLLALLGLINGYSLNQYYFNPNYQRENWRALHQEIKQKFPMNDSIIVFAFTDSLAPWKWYDQGKFPFYSTETTYLPAKKDLKQSLKKIRDYNFVILFDYLRDLTDPEDQLSQEIEAYGYQGIGVIDYPQIGFVRIYSKKNITLSGTMKQGLINN